MKDREFLFYMISENQTFPPRGRKYALRCFAEDAARRLNERENRKCYVIECRMVCNTVAEIGGEQK